MRDAAIGIVYNATGELLLVKRKDLPIWVPPGGGIDPGEKPEASVIREIREETQQAAEIERKVGLWLPINRLAAPTHVFACRIKNSNISLPKETEECREIRFFRRDRLPPLLPLHLEWIKAAEEGATNVERHMENLTYSHALWLFLTHPILVLRYLASRLGFPLNK